MSVHDEYSLAGEILRELRSVREDVRDVRRRLDALAEVLAPPVQRQLPLPGPCPAEQLVTLDQAAALVCRSKRSMERYRYRGMPDPRVRGSRGRPSLWAWPEMRAWLEATFGFNLPESFPGQVA